MDRHTLIEKLKLDIARGSTVTIVGTGVSVASCGNQEVEGFRVATWPGLLYHGVKHCKDIGVADESDVDLLNMQIKSGKTDFLVNAAETISQRMNARSEGTFRGWLKDTIGTLKVKDRSVLDALAALPGVLATLNYDSLLEDATGRHAVTWLETDGVQEVLTGNDTRAVLHLHGWFTKPDSVVLGLSSYAVVKDHPHAKAVLDLFTIDRTVVFVGCGDTVLDPNFTRLIEWAKQALSDVAPRHYLLCRTSEVPVFQEKLRDASWLQPLDYGTGYEDLAPFLRRLAPAGVTSRARPSAAPSRASLDLAGYQQAMRTRYRRIRLEELDPTTEDMRPLTLSGMFIEQSARECVEFMPRVFELPKELQRRLREKGEFDGGELDEELLAQHRRAYLDQSPHPVLEIVNDPDSRRLVVLGDPGSGKSTLLQYLVLDWAMRAAPNLATEPLPLLIELREYARLRHEGTVDDFLGYLHDGASVRWHLNRAQLDAWLRDNPSWILFDGLDEVFDPVLRREVSTAIHRFADEYRSARVIVTSRIIGYQHQAWRDEGFRHFMLQELEDQQIADFLARWHRVAYEETDKGEAKRVRLADAIEHAGAIRQLAGNPLLLTMMAIINRTQDLPRDRGELYEQCARVLLHRWKVDLAFAPDPELAKASLDFKDKRELLLRVARAIHSSEGGLAANLIDEDSLERTLAEGLKGVPNLRPERAARALIDQLRGRNFMLCSVGGHSYAFVHRTFLEYFCAVEIRERFQTEQSLAFDQLRTQIFGHWADEKWHEVLTLLAGMLAPKFLAVILEWLLEQDDPDDTSLNVFLAARCVGAVRRREELGAIETRVRQRTEAAASFEPSHYYSGWVEHTLAVSIGRRAVETVAGVWHQSADAHAWLKARAGADRNHGVRQRAVRQSAVRQIARGWKVDRDTLPWLKALAETSEDAGVRETAARELARGWRDDPETARILKALALGDEDAAVRRSTVQELARGWKDDPETESTLKACAAGDKDAAVRAIAVQELARGWKNDAATLPWLKARVRGDEGVAVRQSAVQALARGWKDAPETVSILKTRGQHDEDAAVRMTALEELARGWKDDPETVSILKARAQDDEFTSVRLSAVRELARIWRDSAKALPWLKARAQGDKDPLVRLTVVKELARGRKGDPKTFSILKGLASEDDGFVRGSAIQELARGWKEDPETLLILKTRVQGDDFSAVRTTAALELARGWKDDPETLLILKARAQDDEAHVRLTVLKELVRGWKDDPETFSILKSRAQNDKDSNVRQTAFLELARGWKTEPETLSILKARAQSDEHAEVRESASVELARGWKRDPAVQEFLETLRKDAPEPQ